MTHSLQTLSDAARRDAVQAAQLLEVQLRFSGSNPAEGYRRAGLPASGRVLVVIGYQGCIAHDFERLERVAKANNATLYVIHGNPDGPDADSPSISVGTRRLDGVIAVPRDAAGRILPPAEIVKIASMLGLSANLQGGDIKTVNSTGMKLFENGQLTTLKEATIPNQAEKLSRA